VPEEAGDGQQRIRWLGTVDHADIELRKEELVV
jgi:hypothetical protein